MNRNNHAVNRSDQDEADKEEKPNPSGVGFEHEAVEVEFFRSAYEKDLLCVIDRETEIHGFQSILRDSHATNYKKLSDFSF